jgi:hypothetical protein
MKIFDWFHDQNSPNFWIGTQKPPSNINNGPRPLDENTIKLSHQEIFSQKRQRSSIPKIGLLAQKLPNSFNF